MDIVESKFRRKGEIGNLGIVSGDFVTEVAMSFWHEGRRATFTLKYADGAWGIKQ